MPVLKLIVDKAKKGITQLERHEVINIRQQAENLSFQDKLSIYEGLLAPIEPAFRENITSPDWLVSLFQDDVWICVFGKSKKILDFRISIDDGSLLTDKSNQKLLNTLKYWLCALTHPRYCGGQNMKKRTLHQKILRALHILDFFIINASTYKLSKHGLALITRDDLFGLLVSISTKGSSEAVYRTSELLSSHLKQKAKTITAKEVEVLAEQFPSIKRLSADTSLDLTHDQIIKARVWLHKTGGFKAPRSKGSRGYCSLSQFKNEVYCNTLHGKSLQLKGLDELRVISSTIRTEYLAVPVTEAYGEGGSEKLISRYVQAVKSLAIVSDAKIYSGIKTEELDQVDLAGIKSLIELKDSGRFRSLPARLVFKSIEDASIFIVKYGDDILNTVYETLISVHSATETTLIDERNTAVRSKISTTLARIGVSSWKITKADNALVRPDDYFRRMRANESLVDLYEVLMGSIQMIVGIMMARRVSEIRGLKPDCLIPDVNPCLPENQRKDYFLVFENRKSGDQEEREELARPIMRFGAIWLWKLKEFRGKLIAANMLTKEASMLVSIEALSLNPTSISRHSYSKSLDIFCDYFEMDVLDWPDGTKRRFYLRQHQLRRFFAMSFFWGSGFDGLESMRYFLGHTDAEHLWHYITENTPGVVMRGVKAERVIYGLKTGDIEGIERLRETLKTRMNVDDIVLDQLTEKIDEIEGDVKEGFVETTPDISTIRQQIELDIDRLLFDGVIDLEPEFITIRNEKNETEQRIHLILKFKEVN